MFDFVKLLRKIGLGFIFIMKQELKGMGVVGGERVIALNEGAEGVGRSVAII